MIATLESLLSRGWRLVGLRPVLHGPGYYCRIVWDRDSRIYCDEAGSTIQAAVEAVDRSAKQLEAIWAERARQDAIEEAAESDGVARLMKRLETAEAPS